jgi:hypothetical protein
LKLGGKHRFEFCPFKRSESVDKQPGFLVTDSFERQMYLINQRAFLVAFELLPGVLHKVM